MEFYDFPYIGNFIIPIDELIFFRGVENTKQYMYINPFPNGYFVVIYYPLK